MTKLIVAFRNFALAPLNSCTIQYMLLHFSKNVAVFKRIFKLLKEASF